MVRTSTSLRAALRKRLLAAGENRMPLRLLVSEFGKRVTPEIAYRAYKRYEPEGDSVIALTEEQMIAFGRVRVVVEALSRLGAKYEGSRSLSMDRAYHLPADARMPQNETATFVKSPPIPEAVLYLRGRLKEVSEGRLKFLRHDDTMAIQALVVLAEAVGNAGMTEDFVRDQEVRREVTRPSVSSIVPPSWGGRLSGGLP